MATAGELVALGLPPALANAIGATGNIAVAQAGSGQSTATALTADFSVITSGTGGVILPSPAGQSTVYVVNQSGASCNVYPQVGGIIYVGANNTLNAAVSISNSKSATFEPFGINWVANLSA